MRTFLLVFIACSIFIVGLIVHASIKAMNKQTDNLFNLTLQQEDIQLIFPKTAAELEERVNRAIENAQKEVEAIIAIPAHQRTYENTIAAFDRITSYSDLGIIGNAAFTLKMSAPHDELRKKAEEMFLRIVNFCNKEISGNKKLFQSLKEYADQAPDTLQKEEKRALNKIMENFEREGINFSDETTEKICAVKEEINSLIQQFENNIAQDNRSITVEKKGLAGLSDDYIENLEKSADNKYRVKINIPNLYRIMDQCTVESTRKQFYQQYKNRAYPANEELAHEIIKKRQELAELLGFETYAAYDLAPTMAQSPENVQKFVEELITYAQPKETDEFNTLVQTYKQEIRVPGTDSIEPWNRRYLANRYKKCFYNADDDEIAQYFPMEQTIEKLMKVYETFFGITFTQIPCSGLWHKDVKLVAVDDTNNKRLGYILLDLHPRDNKFTSACQMTIVPSIADDKNRPGLGIIMANFEQSTEKSPSLMKLSEVQTFFHEFGHTLHGIFSRTKMGCCSGLNVLFDFVETPSQMFEEWLQDKNILQMISSHHKTGEPLPEKIIANIIASRNLASGAFLQQQCFYTLFLLDCYNNQSICNLNELDVALRKKILTHVMNYEDEHFYTALWHFGAYGAKYHTYPWSLVNAHDLANKVKESGGFLNPEIGKKLKDMVLSKGDSEDPTVLMEQFLERKPNNKAFLHNFGLLG